MLIFDKCTRPEETRTKLIVFLTLSKRFSISPLHCAFVKIHTNHDGVSANMIILKLIAARSSWRSPLITIKQASETTSAALRVKKESLLSHISHCSRVLLHFFRALAASYVLYNRTEHSEGFSIC